VPKEPTQAASFLRRYPEFDGRGIKIAIFDTGVDPGAVGLAKTTDGQQKIIDLVDATGSGDIAMNAAIAIPDDRVITTLSGRSVTIPDANGKWSNPNNEVRLGTKKAYDLFPKPLQDRVTKKRKEKFDVSHANTIADLKQQSSLLNKDDRQKKDLEKRISHLQNLMNAFEDPGPILDVISWHDGNTWRAVVCSGDEDAEDLSQLRAMAAYKEEFEYGTFSNEDLMNYSLNFYDNGDIVSVVTTAGSHGTHVCGIVGAYHEDEPELNGVAPGAQFISVKIGDSRLGSMETGPGLVRGLIAAKEAGCDLINMSYGEPTSMSNSGRFVRYAKKLVNEHNVVFVSSAGNAGPALSTVGAPAATTPGLISVGAYVTEDMMEAQYALREIVPANQFSWSSRGPSKDGALGVSISAPGCSISPVPTYTLSKNQRMNGTSMSSPNACGGIALLLSALKSQNKQWNPSYIQRAVENTAKPLENLNPLSMGYGVLQVEDAYDYLQDFPYDSNLNMWYTVICRKRGSRGIYLREKEETNMVCEEFISVRPFFQKDIDNKNKLNFEKRFRIVANQDWIQVPKFLHLANSENSFYALIDPKKLEPGQVHLGEIVGLDSENMNQGPAFRIPVTVVKPESLPLTEFKYNHLNIQLKPGALERHFIHVPNGARCATFTIETMDFVPASKRVLMLHAIQLIPKESYNFSELKNYLSIYPRDQKVLQMSVKGGHTLEITLGQFWSSLGDSAVNLRVEFSGITMNDEVTLFEPVGHINMASDFKNEHTTWKSHYEKLCWHVRPSDSEIICRKDPRNYLFTDKYIQDMILTYNFSTDEPGKYVVRAPVFNDVLYEAEYEASMIQVFDKNKKLMQTLDFKPLPFNLPKGDFVARLHLRHENTSLLEQKRHAVIIVEKHLANTIPTDVYRGSVNHALIHSKKNKMNEGFHQIGTKSKLFLAAPATAKMKGIKEGMWFEGFLNWHPSLISPVTLKYPIPPIPVKPKNTEADEEKKQIKLLDNRSAQEKLKDALIDERVKFTKALLKESKEEGEDLLQTLTDAYPRDLRVLTLKLDHLFENTVGTINDSDVINTADLIGKCIDMDALAVHFGTLPKKPDPYDYQLKKDIQDNNEKKKFLVNALYKRAIALLNQAATKNAGPSGEAVENNGPGSDEEKKKEADEIYQAVKNLRKWTDTKKPEHLLAEVRFALYEEKYGEALELMKPFLIENKEGYDAIEKDIVDIEKQIYQALGWDHWTTYKSQWKTLNYPQDYPAMA